LSRGNWLREVIDIEFDFVDAVLGPGVIFCGLPRTVDQLHVSEILYCQTAPVIRCTRRLETANAVAAVLVAQHLEPPTFVPAQQVRTEQPSSSPVECGDRSAVNDRGADLGVSLLRCANGNRHQSQNIALPEAVDSQMR